MALMKTIYYCIFTVVILTAVLSEVEGRRKILRGRRTMTRDYYRTPLIPAWGSILLIGIGILIAGGITYGVAYKVAISDADYIGEEDDDH